MTRPRSLEELPVEIRFVMMSRSGGTRMLYCKNGHVVELLDLSDIPRGQGGLLWGHFSHPTEEEIHVLLENTFMCHPLVVEDVLHFGQRPKLDFYHGPRETHVFISFYAVRKELDVQEFCLIVSTDYVLTIAKESLPEIEAVYRSARTNPDYMRDAGVLLHQILDEVVDRYVELIDELETRIENFEHRIFNHPEARMGPIIFRLKRRLHKLRRIVADGRSVINLLSHESFPYKDEAHAVYFIDVYDHISRVVDELDGVRDALNGLLDLQTSQRANRMNEVMKTLTIISTIFLPLSFIVGLYGMNFKDIPELSWGFGYIYAWGLMISVTLVFIWYFKRKGWW